MGLHASQLFRSTPTPISVLSMVFQMPYREEDRNKQTVQLERNNSTSNGELTIFQDPVDSQTDFKETWKSN